MKFKEEYPVKVLCKVLGFPTSSYYYKPKGLDDASQLRKAIDKLAEQWPTYGYRRITAMLQRQGFQVNGKPSSAPDAGDGLAAKAQAKQNENNR